MTFGESGPTMTAAGSTVAVASSLVAQQSSADIGNAAIIVATGGLITGAGGVITQLFKLWLDGKNYSQRIKQLEADLAGTRDRNHKMRAQMQGVVYELQAKQMEADTKAEAAEKKATEAAIRAARLEGLLGITDKTHAAAINTNADNINIVAKEAGVPLPVHPPHVDPILLPQPDENHDVIDPSDDDITPFFRTQGTP